MKKIIPILLMVGLTTFYSCGPDKAEIARREKIKLDSIHVTDSIANTMKKAKFMQDSIANAASVAKVKAHLDSIDNAKTQYHKKGVMSKAKKH